MTRTHTIVARHSYKVSAERVFDAWLDPAKARHFLFATPTGKNVRCDIDARVGGTFIITDRRDGQEIEHHGTYTEISRPRRLVFDFSVPQFSNVKTQVAIDIVPNGETCELTLNHRGVLEDFADRTREGWIGILHNLQKYC